MSLPMLLLFLVVLRRRRITQVPYRTLVESERVRGRDSLPPSASMFHLFLYAVSDATWCLTRSNRSVPKNMSTFVEFAFRRGQYIRFTRHPNIKGREQEHTEYKRGNQSSHNYDGERSLRVGPDAA